MSVPKSRLLDLLKVQTSLFSQTYNPTGIRTGNSVLRQRLKGPSIAAYYPRRTVTYKDLVKAYKRHDRDLETWDEDEEERLEHVEALKARGKGMRGAARKGGKGGKKRVVPPK